MESRPGSDRLEEIVTGWSGTLAGYLLGRWRTLDPDDADDIVAEVMIRVWQRLDRFNPAYVPWRWMTTVADRLAIDRYRREARLVHGLDRIADLVGPEEQVEQWEAAETVKAALAGLPAQWQRALLLCFYHGLTYIEASVEMGVSLGTMRMIIFRARRRLRKERRHCQREEGAA